MQNGPSLTSNTLTKLDLVLRDRLPNDLGACALNYACKPKSTIEGRHACALASWLGLIHDEIDCGRVHRLPVEGRRNKELVIPRLRYAVRISRQAAAANRYDCDHQ